MILLVSVSARMLAEMAAPRRARGGRAGPLRRPRPAGGCARACRSRTTSAAAAGWRSSWRRPRGSAADSVVYGAGLENRPDLVARLAAGRTLLGCDPDTLRRVRDPATLGASLRAAGLAFPPTYSAAEARGTGGCRARRWLRKPLRGGGGRGVRQWRGGRLPAGVVVQERIRGLPCSAAAVADGRSAVLLGVSEQLVGRRALGARGFQWCGNVAPPRLPVGERRALADAAQAICAHVAAAFGLRGLFGVDVVWDGEQAWVLEVNPRPVASLETIAAVHAVRPFAAHLEACAGRAAGRSRRWRSGRGGREGGASSPPRTCASRTPATWPARGIRDVPHPGEAIARAPADLHARGDGSLAGGRARPISRHAPPRCARSSPRGRCRRLSTERHATCGGCSLVCDDITAVVGEGDALERLESARARSATPGSPSASRRRRRPRASTVARPAWRRRSTRRRRSSRERARRSSTGWARRRCETQRVAVALADALGAVIDPAGALLDGASGLAFQALGTSTATLGDIRDRAEVVVVWRADPATTQPRLFERLRLPDPDRVLVVVDERRTATAEQADMFLELPADGDVDALWRCGRSSARRRSAEAADRDPPLGELAARLRGCRNGAILHHLRGHVEALALHALVRDLSRVAHVVAVTLRQREQRRGRAGRARLADRAIRRRSASRPGYPRASGRAERGRRARARRGRRGARRGLRSARPPAAGGRRAPALDPRRVGRQPRHGHGRRGARRVHDRRARRAPGRRRPSVRRRAGPAARGAATPRGRATRTCSRRSPSGSAGSA